MLLPFTYSHTKPQSERAYFTAIKCIGPFTDQNNNFPSLPYPTTCEIPTISYPSSRKKGNPFLGRASCVGHNREYPPPLPTHTPSLLPDAIASVIHCYKVAKETESN